MRATGPSGESDGGRGPVKRGYAAILMMMMLAGNSIIAESRMGESRATIEMPNRRTKRMKNPGTLPFVVWLQE